MHKFRTLVVLVMCLSVTSCGCTDDTNFTTVVPAAAPAILGIKTTTGPIPVDPPAPDPSPIPIDITFVLDDSESFNNAWLGILPSNPEDRRPRTLGAQTIMSSLEQNVRARLEAQYQDEGLPVPDLDFAYAVTRYEDFGGEFTNLNRRGGPVAGPNNDMDARPFILNMPILRQNHPNFASQFSSALSREAPGDGNPRYVSSNGTVIAVNDAQSGIEALYQIAAPQNPDQTWGGFDANGNGSTLDSGQPTSLGTQTAPGDSGDVPAIAFVEMMDVDPDGWPQYAVTDEDGNAVMIAAPGGGTTQSISSGNIGGVGWREDSVRFVILASDIATVTPTETTPTGEPEFPSFLPPPCVDDPNTGTATCESETITSTDGNDPAPDAPRESRTVLLRSFDGPPQVISGLVKVTQRRTGVADGPVHDGGNGIAPVGAHTIQATIARLNELDIEVLLMGTPFDGGLDTKPGDTGVNGDIDSHVESDRYDPSDPTTVESAMAPWFWFNGMTRLTMPEVTSIAFGGGEALFPAVYNIATVWPYDDTASKSTGNPATLKNTVTDDVVERIRDWVDNGFIDGGSGSNPTERPPLPTVFYEYQLNIGAELADLQQVQPLEGGLPITQITQVVQIPTYWSDETPPADVTVAFPLPSQAPFTYIAADPNAPLPVSETIPFDIQAKLDRLDNTSTENQEQQDEILAWIQARGDGATPPNPLPTPFDPFTQAAAEFLATVRSSSAPGPSAQLTVTTTGCAILNDLAPGQDSSDQVGGTCPFPAPPPTPAALRR